ncbi:phospholipase D-like domain-containing protein [Antrihabitans cavernicola]|uniref:Phospholipase n=1 Tax=Antrihabitans cavernicola TaxID=2495913 RepID=A0A5A7S986_9NOCA|nr:phospholipase D-like domain-containing protein [Spelaeibacter cavernicola]KAA0022044.1 phospholipase [Spelaeibacter cavernicola]
MSGNGNGAVLIPGDTCWRIERADRLTILIDAEDYFRAAKASMLQARKRIMLIGWDFDTRIDLEPHKRTLPGPNQVGRFLRWLTHERPELEIYLLKWDLGTLSDAIPRGMPPVFLLNWITGKRLHLQADSVHPPGAAHHQKIVVIDDAIAFCGGIDMTVNRWDSRAHLDDDTRRTNPNGEQHDPWHDATIAVDGAAARALGDLARERWHTASGEELAPIEDAADYSTDWPQSLEPTIRDVDVAITRTLPELEDRTEIREVEALFLAAVAAAETTLYIENQYLASRTIAEAVASRLAQPNCPEIVLVIARNATGWLEQKTMDGARHRLLRLLWKADRNDRLSVYYPVTAAGEPIYVHAKVLVLDDRMLRVGSANLNNRSMGFDTECDLALEAVGDDAQRITDTVLRFRDDLIAEHLDTTVEAVRAAIAKADGSVQGAIESLRTEPGAGRTLVPFDRETVEGEDSALAENELMDPETAAVRFPDLIRRVWNRFG